MASSFSWAVPTNLRNNAEPVEPSDAATKNYVDNASGGGAGAVVPAIYFTATADGNNQTFSNTFIAAYTSNTDITLFYNGALLDSGFYTLLGDTITITTPISTGDSIDIIRTAISNANAISGYSNVQANAFLAAGLVGNILPDGDAVYSLGGPINQWKDLWVSNSTIYFNTVPLSANNNTLTFAGEPLLISNGSSNITTTGIIETGGIVSDGNVVANTGYFFLGDGGLLSNIAAGSNYSNANVASYLPTYTGDLSSVGNIGSTGDINAIGNITAFGNVVAATGAFFVGDGGLLSNISGAGDYSNANVETYLPFYTGNLDSVDAITTSGNITANAGAFFIGDGGLLSNISGGGSYGNAEVANYLPTYTGNLGNVDSITAANLEITGSANLGSNATVTITGGTSGQYLRTDGSGVLSWAEGTTTFIPAIYFPVVAAGNNQTFSNSFLASYTSNTEITLFYNGVLLESTYYTLAGDTITVNVTLAIGDSIDLIQTAAGNVNVVTGTYANSNVEAYLNSGQMSDIIPAGNAVYSLGNVSNQWKDLWVSNATIYFNSVPLSANNNTLTFAGEPILVSGGDTNITTTGTIETGGMIADGNITANTGYFFLGDGGLLSNISTGTVYSNANVAAYMPTYTGNLGNVDNITASGTISGNGVGLSDIAGANVTGQVANALVAGTVYTNAQPNITSVGSLTSLDVVGNITLGAGGFFIGDGGLLSNISGGGGTYGNGDVAVYLPTYTGNLDNVDSITTTGNITVGSGAYFVGDGTYLTNVPGAVAESPFSIETASFSAVAGARYGVDTTGGAVTATLPATPATGQAIFFADAGGAYATNNLTVARNGQTIMGDASDLTVNTTNQNFGLFWNGTTWRTY